MEKNISFSSDPTKGFIIYFFSLYVHIYTKRALCIFIINPSKVIIAITILEASIIDSNNFSSLSLRKNSLIFSHRLSSTMMEEIINRAFKKKSFRATYTRKKSTRIISLRRENITISLFLRDIRNIPLFFPPLHVRLVLISVPCRWTDQGMDANLPIEDIHANIQSIYFTLETYPEIV